MRVGLIAEKYDPEGGGAERWAADFAVYLVQAGHEVHVITFKCAGDIGPLKLHLLRDPGTLIGRAEAVAQAVTALPPMVLRDGGTSWSGHVFHPQTGSRLLCVQADLASRPAGERFSAWVSPRVRWRHYLMGKIEARAMARAERVIAMSSRLARVLGARHRLAPERLRLIRNGVDTGRFTAERMAVLRAPMRAELRLGDAFTGILTAYNLRLKGLETALRAIAVLQRDAPDVRLLVAGGMPDTGLAGLVQTLGLQGKILFCGGTNAIERLYAAADVCVHPARWDACSLAVIEAMAAGLPVITTAQDGASDFIHDGEDGFVLADPWDHRRLAAILGLLADEPVRRRIGDAARLNVAGAARQGDNFLAVEAVLAEVHEMLPNLR